MYNTGTDPWHLTVIRTRGLRYLRPEKSWRPIVCISVAERGHETGVLHEIVLGCDGQNPNLKSAIQISDVKPTTRLVIQVFHKSQTKKKNRKRTLVGTANLSVDEFLNRHPLPHPSPVEYEVRLSCPPPQRKSPTISGKQQHSAALTLKLAVPHTPSSRRARSASPFSDSHVETDGMFSDGASSSKGLIMSSTAEESASEAPWEQPPEPETLSGPPGLRRRRRKTRGFCVDSASEGPLSESSDEDPWLPPLPTPPDDYFGTYDEKDWELNAWRFTGNEDCEEAVVSPSVLPMHSEQASVYCMPPTLSLAESFVDTFGPYHELREADEEDDVEKAEKILGRLLTEWYVVGASLLALAGIDAAVFGFAPDSTSFTVDGFSRSVVAIGAIAAGLGLVSDAWFLVLYSGANGAKFQRVAKDVYNSYFFFCLTCRLPTMCMFLSTLSLMFFLLAVAWTAWPTAVLVMSFAAGILLTSQFLVFGIHRAVNFIIWVVRVAWRKAAGARQTPSPPHLRVTSEPQTQSVSEHRPVSVPSPARASAAHDGIQMPVPEPAAV
ncbi:hypothetical protein C2E23DRAFT_884079 [Lenzites betulinus]|nr:hypothetical protein C2E23DRAFT_884079 [Lenzites betulinus]